MYGGTAELCLAPCSGAAASGEVMTPRRRATTTSASSTPRCATASSRRARPSPASRSSRSRGSSRALGVDVIEAGFPASSPDDLHAVRRIAEEVGTDRRPDHLPASPAATAATSTSAGRGSSRRRSPRIHTFIASSDLHMERKLDMTRDQVTAQMRDMVGRRGASAPTSSSQPEDAPRSDIGSWSKS